MSDTPAVTRNLVSMYGDSRLQTFYYRLFCRRTGVARLPREARILDCACGSGGLLRVLRGLGFTGVEGFDAAADMVELSRATGFRVVCCDAREMAAHFDAGRFDAVIVANFLHHLVREEDWDRFLDQCRRALKPGGLWVNREPCSGAWPQRCFRWLAGRPDGVLARFPAIQSRVESWRLEKANMEFFDMHWEPHAEVILMRNGLSVRRRFRLIDSTLTVADAVG